MTNVVPLGSVRRVCATPVPEQDPTAAPHVDVDDGLLGSGLRVLGALLSSASNTASAGGLMNLWMRVMPGRPGEAAQEIRIVGVPSAIGVHLKVEETLDGRTWHHVAILGPWAATATPFPLAGSRQWDTRAFLAVWAMCSDVPRAMY